VSKAFFRHPIKRGRPPAPRRTLHPAFVAALSAVPLTKTKVAAAAQLGRDELAHMRAGHEFPATGRTLEKLRRVAARIGYLGPIVATPHVKLRCAAGYQPAAPLDETEALCRDVISAGVVGGAR
jgi:hypothetical protein